MQAGAQERLRMRGSCSSVGHVPCIASVILREQKKLVYLSSCVVTHTHGSAAAPPRIAPFARRVPGRSSHVPRLGSRMPCVLALRIRIHFEDSARRVSRTAQCRTGSPDRPRTGRCSHQRNAHRPHPTRGSGAAGALQRDAAREVRSAQRPQIPSHRAVPPVRQRRSDMGGEANASCRRSCDDLLLVSHLQSALGGAVTKKNRWYE